MEEEVLKKYTIEEIEGMLVKDNVSRKKRQIMKKEKRYQLLKWREDCWPRRRE